MKVYLENVKYNGNDKVVRTQSFIVSEKVDNVYDYLQSNNLTKIGEGYTTVYNIAEGGCGASKVTIYRNDNGKTVLFGVFKNTYRKPSVLILE